MSSKITNGVSFFILFLIVFSMEKCSFAQEVSEEWVYKGRMNTGFRELSTFRKVLFSGQDCTVKISFGFNCTPNFPIGDVHSGIVIEVKILNHERFPDFHFDDFEGPDPETDRIASGDLMTIKIENSGSVHRYSCNPNGWQSEGGFSFGFGGFDGNKKLVNEILAGARSMVIGISDSRNPGKRMVIPVLFSGNHDVFLFKALTEGLN